MNLAVELTSADDGDGDSFIRCILPRLNNLRLNDNRCGKARRESQNFNGIALVRAVFEHNDWFFSG